MKARHKNTHAEGQDATHKVITQALEGHHIVMITQLPGPTTHYQSHNNAPMAPTEEHQALEDIELQGDAEIPIWSWPHHLRRML